MSAFHGKEETERLRKNLEDQLERLVQQLEDLEEIRDELEQAEYEETKEDTMEQLRELNDSLQRLISGDVSLVNQLGAMQMATRAAISAAFKTPAIIRMFGKREPDQLREKLVLIDRDQQLGKLTSRAAIAQQSEVISALQHLGETLTPAEILLVEKIIVMAAVPSNFVKAGETRPDAALVLRLAGEEIKATQIN